MGYLVQKSFNGTCASPPKPYSSRFLYFYANSLVSVFAESMSLLSGYKKKTSYDGYESLQLVDSSGDFNNGGRGGGPFGGSLTAVTLGSKAGPARPDDYSTMDSSGKRYDKRRRVCCRFAEHDQCVSGFCVPRDL